MHVFPIPAFADNYIWLIEAAGSAAVVDPGEHEPVERALEQRGLELRGILLTHHHADHVGGAAALARRHGCAVHGPPDDRIDATTQDVRDGDRVRLDALGIELAVLEIPGHTLTHIAFAGEALLFCGDTLFGAGCGRLFEGSPAQMLTSLDRLAALPGATRVHCGHEYTLANLAFAAAVEPANAAIGRRAAEARDLRARGEPTLPSTIEVERATNPFLRCDVPEVVAAAERFAGAGLEERVAVFAALRRWKDGFRSPA